MVGDGSAVASTTVISLLRSISVALAALNLTVAIGLTSTSPPTTKRLWQRLHGWGRGGNRYGSAAVAIPQDKCIHQWGAVPARLDIGMPVQMAVLANVQLCLKCNAIWNVGGVVTQGGVVPFAPAPSRSLPRKNR